MSSDEQFIQTVEWLHQQDVNTVLLNYGQKTPVKGILWKDRDLALSDYKSLLNERVYNLGLQSGGSSNVVILDFDSLELFSKLMEIPLIRYLFENTLIIQTPGRDPHGYHMVIKAPETTYNSKDYTHGVDIKGQNSYTVIPPSVHPNGKPYFFFRKLNILTLSWAQWNELKTVLHIRTENRIAIPQIEDTTLLPETILWKSLTTEQRNALHKRQLSKKYRQADSITFDPSRADASIMLSLIKNGFSKNEIFRMFYAYAHRAHKIHKSNRYDYLQITYKNILEYYLTTRSFMDMMIDLAWGIVPHLFTGRTAHSDSTVMRTILWKMKRANVHSVSISIREIEQITGLSLATVQKTIKRILKMQYLKYTRPAWYIKAQSYQITDLFFDEILASKQGGGKSITLLNAPHIKDSTLGKPTPCVDALISTERVETNNDYDDDGEGYYRFLYDSIGMLDWDVASLAFIMPLKASDILHVTDYTNYKALGSGYQDLILYINAHINEPIPFKLLMEYVSCTEKTLKTKLKKISEVIPVTVTYVPQAMYCFEAELNERKLNKIAKNCGTKNSCTKRTKRIAKERKEHNEYFQEVVVPKLYMRKLAKQTA